MEPDFLLLDEPTSALDSEAAVAIEQEVAEHAAAGRLGALVVTHDAAQAARWCDRTVDLVPHVVLSLSRAPAVRGEGPKVAGA